MRTIIVVDNPADWTVSVPDAEMAEARAYLTDTYYTERRRARVYNLCRSYRYQSSGYYVSLLAEARGHKPLPTITTIQDLKSIGLIRSATEELDELLQKTLAPEPADELVRFIAFGRSLDGRYEALSSRLFRLFPAPFLEVTFGRQVRTGVWSIISVNAVSPHAIPGSLKSRLQELEADVFAQPALSPARRKAARFDLAILRDPNEEEPPSNARALRQFVKAGEELGLAMEFIEKDDYALLPQFDALFIRVTTNVNHYTYRFARKAASQELVVIDDPVSIFRCCNKVYVDELLRRHGVPMPDTVVVHKGSLHRVVPDLGLPCVLKLPDSSFSQGVVRVDDEAGLEEAAGRMLDRSDLVIAQRFVPTSFDWRVGILGGKPLYVCKYFMAREHWQIIKRNKVGVKAGEGETETLRVEDAPPAVVETALRAARLIGDGLYGVDLKEIDGRPVVMEINDNPSLDAGVEDAVLGSELYRSIMETFLRRLEKLRGLERA